MFRAIPIILLMLAGLATAAERLEIDFRDGKSVHATVTAADEEGVTYLVGGKERTAPWEEVEPRSAFEIRKAFTPFDDGEARIGLSDFARELRLFPEAMEQLEIALALGALTEAKFEERARVIEGEEIAFLKARIDALLESGEEPEVCLAAIKRLRSRYPEHAANEAYESAVKRLVDAIAKDRQAEKDAAASERESAALKRLRKKVERIQEKKEKMLARAKEHHDAGLKAAAKGQISRMRRHLVEGGAERYYKYARKYLRDIARADRRHRIVSREELVKEEKAIIDKLVDCYLVCAREYLDHRNYKRAAIYVRQILYYDPIHEEALEMVETIRDNRITFKLSEITNARPRVTGG